MKPSALSVWAGIERPTIGSRIKTAIRTHDTRHPIPPALWAQVTPAARRAFQQLLDDPSIPAALIHDLVGAAQSGWGSLGTPEGWGAWVLEIAAAPAEWVEEIRWNEAKPSSPPRKDGAPYRASRGVSGVLTPHPQQGHQRTRQGSQRDYQLCQLTKVDLEFHTQFLIKKPHWFPRGCVGTKEGSHARNRRQSPFV
jgi:hypothetical protein